MKESKKSEMDAEMLVRTDLKCQAMGVVKNMEVLEHIFALQSYEGYISEEKEAEFAQLFSEVSQQLQRLYDAISVA